ncbi:hypothetical protein O1F58_004015 [Yersinia enterocolitica]|uniref:hypothetical protein n=1 Tax=Yersinia enterocolitica TaxID=630 RepID=UPI001C60F9E7|nr:hypothetical protein [Yersinia enterocolitica]EKN3576007.1 hypothetical protein [Yersinia enterocolitica]MBW5861856.1 hypothetical protein [Yersinia enterocolitica]MBW5871484.1 hypothetical protein [Yersinia enterocolitica]UYK03335.1 hypothetical protein N4221_07900 [Yersinia enterocolitica]HDL7594144.1 hypothetical protein [Yersinia enterocolitica]
MTEEIKTGGPAFPFVPGEGSALYESEGMQLRDYFAAKAIAVAWSALAAGYFEADAESSADKMAICAYQLADAMIKARG